MFWQDPNRLFLSPRLLGWGNMLTKVDPDKPEVAPDASQGTGTTAVPLSVGVELDSDVNIVGRLIGHRLQQDDINKILETLSNQDRHVFTEKLSDILRKTSALLEVSRRVSDSMSLDVLLPRMVEIVSDFL